MGAPHCMFPSKIAILGITLRCRHFRGWKSTGNGGFNRNVTELNRLVGGWPTPLKNDGVKVSWDDDIPNIWIYIYMESHKIPWFQPTISSVFSIAMFDYRRVNPGAQCPPGCHMTITTERAEGAGTATDLLDVLRSAGQTNKCGKHMYEISMTERRICAFTTWYLYNVRPPR